MNWLWVSLCYDILVLRLFWWQKVTNMINKIISTSFATQHWLKIGASSSQIDPNNWKKKLVGINAMMLRTDWVNLRYDDNECLLSDNAICPASCKHYDIHWMYLITFLMAKRHQYRLHLDWFVTLVIPIAWVTSNLVLQSLISTTQSS